MKERIKERTALLKDEFRGTAIRLSMKDASVLTKSDRIAVAVTVFLSILLLAGIICQSFAAGDPFSQAESIAKDWYGKLFSISSIIAGLCIIIGVLWTMLTPTSGGARTPISWIKKVLLCYVIILALGGIFKLIEDLTKGMEFNP